MDIRQLRRFIAVCETGSFNKAADLLAVSQPSLTRSIQQLEADLGGALFERGPRGIVRTQAGEELLPHARLILRERERAIDAIAQLHQDQREVVEIGTDAAFAVRNLPLALARVTQAHSGLELRVREGSIRELLDQLREGRLRLVVASRAPFADLTDLAFEQLALESAGVVMRADHPLGARQPLALSDLVDADWIVPDNDLLKEGWSQMFANAGLAVPTIALRTSSLHLTKACLLAGDFVSLGDHTPFASEIAYGLVTFVDLGTPRYERPAGIFHRHGLRLTEGERHLISALRDVSREQD